MFPELMTATWKHEIFYRIYVATERTFLHDVLGTHLVARYSVSRMARLKKSCHIRTVYST